MAPTFDTAKMLLIAIQLSIFAFDALADDQGYMAGGKTFYSSVSFAGKASPLTERFSESAKYNGTMAVFGYSHAFLSLNTIRFGAQLNLRDVQISDAPTSYAGSLLAKRVESHSGMGIVSLGSGRNLFEFQLGVGPAGMESTLVGNNRSYQYDGTSFMSAVNIGGPVWILNFFARFEPVELGPYLGMRHMISMFTRAGSST